MIAAAFVLVAALLLWVLASTPGFWRPKLALTILLPLLAVVVSRDLDRYRGWPALETPPPHSILIAGLIREPDAYVGDRGAIYLWASPPRATRPRAYEVAYSPPLAEQLARALRAVQHGQTVEVAHGAARSRARGQHVPVSALRFYRLPPPKPPRKTGGS